MSDIAKIIDSVVRDHIHPLLKERGFRKQERTFRKVGEESTLVVNVQASQWNQGLEGNFTLNLGAYFEDIENICDSHEIKGLPKEYDCTVRKRIGQTMPGNFDKWWAITPSTNLAEIGKEVSAALSEYGLPWLESVASKRSLESELESRREYLRASGLCLLKGNIEGAKRFVQKQIKDKPLAASRTKAWAKSHALM
jgi:hypothetical protein